MSTPASYTHRLGEQLRTLRLAKKMLLRQVAIATGLDVAVLSKLERGERKLNERIVLQLGKLYKADVASLLVMLYSNQVLQHIGTEANALDILNVAEEEVLYQQRVKVGPKQLIQKMVRVLELDGRVKKAWLYGSVVRADFSASSDVDVMIEFNKKKKYSLFDLIDIAHRLEQVLHRRVDLHERGTLHDEAQANAENDLQLIYG
jgi:predicted nucleotidyltransferase